MKPTNRLILRRDSTLSKKSDKEIGRGGLFNVMMVER
jgi:hypothetical protein